MFKADKLFFEIHTWTVHVADGWTEQNAENAVDTLELEILQTVDANAANQANWVALQVAGRSSAALEIVSGIPWLHEVIPVMATVTRGANRQTVREAIGTLLAAGVTSAQRVFNYQPAYFGTATQAREVEFPIVYIASVGSERAQ